MKFQIKNVNDVAEFAKQINNEGVSFHPDDNFNDIINFKTGEKIYSNHEADRRNQLLNQSFILCQQQGVDVYEIFNRELRNKIGLSA
ncbi:MAG: hypothetical protein WD555_03430 [Fulvivirga sp.]